MSFFPGGGAGGGWPPPFFNQPPPGGVQPMPFFTDPSQNPQGYPTGMQPDYQQQAYNNPYVQMPPMQGQPQLQPLTHQPQPQVQAHAQVQELQTNMSPMEHSDRSLDHEQRRSEYKSYPSQYSPPSHDSRRSPDKSRRVHRDDDDDDRFARRKRSPVDEPIYRRHGSDERGRQRERIRLNKSSGSPQAHSPKDKPKVDIDALLQDERLRNVLFAGISKATAKLEQSLQDGKERSDFEPQEGKNQLFPSASTSQKPRSILKRKDGGDTGSSKALSNLSALERTLHLLRGKSDIAVESTRPDNRSSSERKLPAPHGALSKLAAYAEVNDEDAHRYKSEKHLKERDSSASSSSKPFWSVPSKLEASKREADSFDAKEKMFEEWRQSIGKQSDASSKADQTERETNRNVERIQFKQGVRKRDMLVGGKQEADNREELDSTVQNILQSIGFNFDLSKRMQELAKKKRMQEDEGTGIRNVSASFMDKGDILAEELKASLLRSGSDLSSIDSLIKEVRASSRSSRVARSPSPDRRSSSYGKEVRETSQSSSRHERSAREEQFGSSKDNRTIYGNQVIEQWEKVSPPSSPPRRHFRENISLSPLDSYNGSARQPGPAISERFRDDGERNEYFYPDKDYTESYPSVPLLTSLSSRKRNEDLTGGLLKSLRVENFRVLSRSTHDNPEDDSYSELRRIILPAKSDQDKGQSPPRTVMRKRSASPISTQVFKERKVSPGYYDDYPRRRSPSGSRQDLRSPEQRYPKESPRRKSLSPRHKSPPPRRRERSRSPNKRRSRSRTRSRSPYRRKSPSYRRRSRSPRQRSPRRRSRSPRRGRSRSPLRKLRTQGSRPSPLRRTRKTPPRRSGRSKSKSNERNSSKRTDADTSNKNRQTASDSKGKQQQGKRDFSKLPEKERQAELRKIVMAMENKDGTAKDDEEDKKMSRVANIVSEFVTLVQLDPLQINKLTTEALLLSVEQQKKILPSIATRKSKVLALKTDLERLKKAQNELMRKSQRSGLGNKDPHLRANNLSQMETEKEIERLSAPDLNVSMVSNFDQNLKEIRSKLEKESVNTKQKVNQNKSKDSSVKDKKASIAQAMEPRDKTNWTSVAVKDGDLPVIAEGDTKDDVKKAKNQKQKSIPTKPRKDVYYEYVDSKNHWCSHCHINLNALDQYFTHLHGKKHFTAINDVAKPWAVSKNDGVTSKGRIGNAQTRRIKGSELLFPVAGFYCTLCTTFCGDFITADKHLKSDNHYDKYLGFIRDNPDYEKKLLLEKTSKGKEQNINPNEKEKKAMPAPLPTSGKNVKKSKSLRQKVEEEKEAVGTQDNLESVDMELDDNGKDDVNATSKVPKMTGKFTNSVTSILSNLPESRSNNNGVEMKSNKEDEVKSLDNFLTIAKDTTESEEGTKSNAKKNNKKSAKIPVISMKKAVNLSNIPIPEPPKLTTIPLPPSSENNAPSTVKTLKEVEDEEKRMMGIDVDEEKPLGLIKRPPPLSQTDKQSDKATELKDETKPKTLDTLLSKVSKASNVNVSQKVKPQTLVAEEDSELEKKIQQGIQEKLEKEKLKLIKQQEKKERMAKKQEEKMMMKKMKKVISDTSTEEDSDSEEEEVNNTEVKTETDNNSEEIKNTEVKMEIGSNNFDLENTDLPPQSENNEAVRVSEKQDDSKNLMTSALVENVEVATVKEEMMETEQITKEDTNTITKPEITENVESYTDSEMKVQIITDSTSMEIDHEKTNDVKQNTEVVVQDCYNIEVSASATMQLIGMGDILGFKEADVKDSSGITNQDVSQVMETTSVPDNNRNESETSDKLLILDAQGNQQVLDTGNESKDVSSGDEKKTTEATSQELATSEGNDAPKLEAWDMQVTEKATESEDVMDTGNECKDADIGDEKKTIEDFSQNLATSEGNDAPKLDTSVMQVMETATESEAVENKSTDGDSISQQEQVKLSVKSSMTKGKKKGQLTKMSVVRALQSESDLLGVLNSSPEVLAKEVQKKNRGSGKAVARRGGKAGTRSAKKIPQAEEVGDISMDDFVVLSEISEDGDIKTGKDESETLISSKTDDDTTEVIEKPDETESIKSVSTVQQSRGGRTSTRGRAKGKRVAANQGKEASPVPEGDSTIDSTETNVAKCTPSIEEKDSTFSIEAKEDEVEQATVPVVSRTRRGRSATKATPAKNGRQTRTRGKKKEVEIEEPVAQEDIKNIDVEDTEINTCREDDTKSENVSSLSDNTDEVSILGKDQSEFNVRATPPGQGKHVTVMVTDKAEENFEIQGQGGEQRKGDGLNEEKLSLQVEETDAKEKPQGRSLRSRQAKKIAVVTDVEKAKEDGDDSDATITEDVEDSINQTPQGLESVTEQPQDLQSSDLLPTRPEMDPPMSSVMEMETTGSGMLLPGKELPIPTDALEFESLPTSGLNVGLDEEEDSMKFPDSLAGFTVIDVEGQPDDDDDEDDELS